VRIVLRRAGTQPTPHPSGQILKGDSRHELISIAETCHPRILWTFLQLDFCNLAMLSPVNTFRTL
jgi:hypothetical protein